MAKRIDVIFGSKIDDAGALEDLKKVQMKISKSDIEIKPTLDDSSIKQFQKNLNITIDKVTKLKKLTSSFVSNGAYYNVTQQQSKNHQYYPAEFTIDEDKTVSSLDQKLKNLYRTAIETQDNINSATKAGTETYANYWRNALSEIEKQIQETESNLNKFAYAGESDSALNRLKGKFELSKSSEDAIKEKKAFDELDVSVNNLISSKTKLAKAEAYGSSDETINALKQEVSLWENKINKIKEASYATDELKKKADEGINQANVLSSSAGAKTLEKQSIEDLKTYDSTLKKLVKTEKERLSIKNKIKNGSIEDTNQTQDYITALNSQISSYKKYLDQLETGMKNTDALNDALNRRAQAEKEVASESARLNAQQQKQISLTDQLSKSFDNMVKNFLNYGLAYKVFEYMEQAFVQSIQTIKDLNAAMVDVQMVTGDTTSQTMELADQYSEMAKELGATTTEIANGASEWLRQGKSVEETNQLLEASMILSKVGAIESSEATELLTSTLNGYKLEAEDAMHVVDAMSKVDLEAATSVEELAVALQNTANIARVNGVEFEELLGMVGAVSEATRRSASVVGNSFKTIFSRMTNVAAGKDTDDEGESLNDVETALKNNGILLRDSVGDWRDMYDVISEVADKWSSFNDVQRSQISTAIAGTRQREIFEALMENWDRSQTLTEAALSSEGSAMEKFEIYLEGIEARIKSLTATFEDFVYSEGTVNIFNFLIDSAKKLIEILDFLINNDFGRLISMSGAVVLAVSKITQAINVMNGALEVSKAGAGVNGIVKVFETIISLKGGLVNTISSLSNGFSSIKMSEIASGTNAAVASFKALGGTIASAGSILMSSPFVVTTAVVAGIYGITKYIDGLRMSLEEIESAISEVSTSIDTAEGLIDELKQKQDSGSITQKELEYLNILEKQNEQLKERLELLNQQKYIEESNNRSTEGFDGIEGLDRKFADFVYNTLGWKGDRVDPGIKSTDWLVDEYKDLQDKLPNQLVGSEQWEETSERISELESIFLDWASAIAEAESNEYDLTEADEYRLGVLEELGLWQEYVKDSTEETTNELSEQATETANVIGEFENLANGLELVSSAQEEAASTGVLSLDTINSIIERYPAMTEQLTNYLLGLASTEDVLSALQNAYSVDEQNAYNNIIAKLKLQENYYSLLSQMDAGLLQQFASDYGVDVSNHSNYAQAKGEIETQLLSQVAEMWSEYYGTQLKNIDQLRNALGDGLPPDVAAKFKKIVDSFDSAVQGLNYVYDQSFVIKLSNSYKQIGNAAKQAASSSGSAADSASDAQEAYNDLLDMTIKMLKKKKELEKEALNEQLDGYKKLIDARKELLEQEQDEYDHKRELEDRNKTIASLEAQIAELQFDTSAEGTKKRLELEEELAEEKRDLEDYQHDYSIEQQENALDAEEERYEEYINAQIDEIDRYLDETGKIEAEAIRLINERSEALFNDLIQYNRTYGDSLDSTVINAWNNAVGAVNNYKAALDSAADSAARLASYSGGGYSGSTTTTTNKSPSTSLNKPAPVEKSVTYKVYNAFGKMVLETEDASKVRAYMALHPATTGTYFMKETYANGKLKLERNTYHKGLDAGFVGNVKGNEQFVKALKGEAFITKEQQDKFMGNILPKIVSRASSYGSTSFDNLLNITVQGNLDTETVPKIEAIVKETFSKLNSAMFKGGYKRNTSTVAI